MVHYMPNAVVLLEAIGCDQGVLRLVHELLERDPSHPPVNATPHVSQVEVVSLAPAKHNAPAGDDGVVPRTEWTIERDGPYFEKRGSRPIEIAQGRRKPLHVRRLSDWSLQNRRPLI